ncbi:MAG: WD40 repeat domain-containing protein [Prochloraceae cyanobacterium]
MKKEDTNSQQEYHSEEREPFREIRARLSESEEKKISCENKSITKQVNIGKYKRFYSALVSHQYPLTASQEQQLENLQQDLQLTAAEAEAIQAKVVSELSESNLKIESEKPERLVKTENNLERQKEGKKNNTFLKIAIALIIVGVGPVIFSLFMFPSGVRVPNKPEEKVTISPAIQLNNYEKYPALSKFITKEAEWINCLAIAPKGNKIIIGSRQGRIIISDLVTGDLIAALTDNSKVDINAIVIAPDGKTMMTGNDRGLIRIWDIEQRQVIHTFRGHSPFSILSLAITADGKKLVSGDLAGSIKVWDLDSKQTIHTLLGHSTSINSLAITDNDRKIVSASNDTTIRVWDIETGDRLQMMKDTTEVFAVVISSNTQTVISGNREGTIRIWDINTGERIKTYKEQLQKISSLAIDPRGNMLVSGSNDRTVVIWNLKNGDNQTLSEKQNQYVNNVAISRDKKTIITTSKNEIKIWRVAGNKE